MATLERTSASSVNIEQFLEYDSKGNPVVLHRSVAHPGTPQNQENLATIQAQAKDRPGSMGGSFRFFADFSQMKEALLEKKA